MIRRWRRNENNGILAIVSSLSPSAKTFLAHELTEKLQSTQQGHKKSHNVGTRLLSGFLVSFASRVVEWNCWMKQQSNTQRQRALMAIQTGCLGALHGSQSRTALNR